jgi:Carboxypeptidase regulatory-like domain/TonB-dependent Receptor Plug Domain
VKKSIDSQFQAFIGFAGSIKGILRCTRLEPVMQTRTKVRSLAVIRVFTVVCFFVSCFFICVIGTSAQNSSSAVSGVVTDPMQAAVVGVKVTLKNVDTNVERVTVSNSAGDYFFSSVQPARYTLTFVAQNFQIETISSFEVAVARNFTQLLTLTPGVTPISSGQNNSASNTAVTASSTTSYAFPSINGAGNRSTIYLVDGMNDNQAWYNTYAVPPIIDTIQEFKINSHNDAQYGGSLGGVVNIVTKSGTNSYHGSGWEFLRSSSFDAKPYFSTALASYHLNTFGGQLGGPVQIPHFYNGKDKTFFEIGAEGAHYSKSGTTNILIPTQAQLNGDFSSAQTGVTKSGTCVIRPDHCQQCGETKAPRLPRQSNSCL